MLQNQAIAFAMSTPLFLLVSNGQAEGVFDVGHFSYLLIPAVGMPLAILILYWIIVGKPPRFRQGP